MMIFILFIPVLLSLFDRFIIMFLVNLYMNLFYKMFFSMLKIYDNLLLYQNIISIIYIPILMKILNRFVNHYLLKFVGNIYLFYDMMKFIKHLVNQQFFMEYQHFNNYYKI
jgi:hypothetical protein